MGVGSVNPRVTLVGAGPGACDLITLRGLKTLEEAEVVLYDALVDEKMLEFVPTFIPKFPVGKRSGRHAIPQHEINRMLAEMAFQFGHAVRLKGGDPFVFGRASEEIDYLEAMGIPVEVVPGISSALAVPAGQGIPLTKRGVARSFWVVTGTVDNGGMPDDMTLAAASSATIVVLMGVRKLQQIARLVLRYRSGSTPIALIQDGSLPTESIRISTLSDASFAFNDIDLAKPGILLIGNVVLDHPDFYEEDIQRLLRTYL